MNVYATDAGPYDYAGSRMSPPAPSPTGKTLVEGYRKDIIIGFEKDPPRFNPMNPSRTQSSVLVDLKDPIQVHLLTETALTDSKQYEILSQEEVDDLKKQIQSLGQRIESTRSNLLIQSKYRDAATSMARLYSPGQANGRRRSLLGRNSGDQTRAKEAEAERHASERKCEELASELFNLEKRMMEPQRRLLEHTAGILQLTHKASKKKDATPTGQPLNGMPGSPESLYTYSRNSMDQAAEGNYFDESPYEFDQFEGLQTTRQPRANAIEIPLKSPIREQTNQLREEMERIKEENAQLRNQQKNQTDGLVHSISEMEVRLETLNGSLRDAIVRFNPAKNDDYDDPPYGSTSNLEPGEMLKSQMDYLETGLFAIQAEQEESTGGEKMDQRIESMNKHIREILLTVDPDYPAPPEASETDVEGQIAYLEDSIRAVDSELERAMDAASVGTSRKKDSDQVEVVLMGLWDIIQSGFAGIKQQKDERRRARAEKGLEDDEGSDDEFDTDEPYTLKGFSARVQWLYQQATTLKDQKSVLKRQIKQQRELNNKSDAEKDEELARKQEEIEESRVLLSRAENESMVAQTMLSEALEDLEKARAAVTTTDTTHEEIEARNVKIKERDAEIEKHNALLQERDIEIQQHSTQLQERDMQIERHNAQLQERDMQIEMHNAQLQERNDQIEMHNTRLGELDAQIQGHHKQLQERDMQIEMHTAQIQEHMAQIQERIAQIQERDAQIEKHNIELEDHIAKIQECHAEIQERDAQIEGHHGQMQDQATQLRERNAQVQEQIEQIQERNSRISALESDLQELQAHIHSAESTSHSSQSKLSEVEQTIASLRAQIEEAAQSKAAAEQSEQELQKQLSAQKQELTAKQKTLKVKEDELEEMYMNFAEIKTELTIAQAELEGAYGSKAERAAEVAAIKTSAEVTKLQNQITRLKKELSGTVQELEDVTKESLSAEREKIELESKLDEAHSTKASLEGEVNSLRERFEEEMNKSHERIAKLQEELDGERLKAVPGHGGTGRPGAGASVLSEQFRSTMREERRKFQEEIREERSRNRKLEEELVRLKRGQGPAKSPLSPR
ncbi:Up-regulated during septation-domain-containing protein [Thelonectria olida]|uniref:Up-regulated during septation-domain-containing protein n=1 Tax=Thelonectria olida TaxID=1576542 RepID=A0A9P8W9R8_9HYPO|nr:Up-regulated during septation-domain-containing protein [Thelonectria olida]